MMRRILEMVCGIRRLKKWRHFCTQLRLIFDFLSPIIALFHTSLLNYNTALHYELPSTTLYLYFTLTLKQRTTGLRRNIIRT